MSTCNVFAGLPVINTHHSPVSVRRQVTNGNLPPRTSDAPGYVDEADVFYADPAGFFDQHYTNDSGNGSTSAASPCDRAHGFGLQNVCLAEPDSWELPSHIVMFDVLWPRVEHLLVTRGYREVRSQQDQN
jgi:hypothetical protein